jgi:hypothetical protein
MKQHLTLVTTTEDRKPACPCTTEPSIVTGPNDPCTVGIQIDTDGVVHMTVGWHTDSNRKPIEISLDRHRADYIGDLLKKAVAMIEEREYAETAAWAAALLPRCPLHDGPSVEGTHCTCDGIQDAYGNPVKSTTA